MTMQPPLPIRSFAAAAASPSAVATHPIPTGSWSVYFHEPEDKAMTSDSYKRLQTVSSWEALGSLLREIGPNRITNGLLRAMKGDISPLWENNANIRGDRTASRCHGATLWRYSSGIWRRLHLVYVPRTPPMRLWESPLARRRVSVSSRSGI